ncbi:hypothetical protein BCEP4_210018 [Burkholderia cepacia]|nr:hypothetical protein BCEP4_210018 [Burkholderia cepacia]
MTKVPVERLVWIPVARFPEQVVNHFSAIPFHVVTGGYGAYIAFRQTTKGTGTDEHSRERPPDR